jgi:hypothetical protein
VTNTIFIWMLVKAMPGAWLGRKGSGAGAPAPAAPSATGGRSGDLVTQESSR